MKVGEDKCFVTMFNVKEVIYDYCFRNIWWNGEVLNEEKYALRCLHYEFFEQMS